MDETVIAATGKKVKMMQTQANQHELLSALADGELASDDMDQALALCAADDHACWQTYQLIGDVMREPALARRCDSTKLLEGVRHAVRQDQLARPAAQVNGAVLPSHMVAPASNDSVFRWKMVAGFASMAAVAAIGWNSLNEWNGAAGAGAQMASAAPTVNGLPVAGSAPGVPTLKASAAPPVMIRDPRLDELLAAHQQYGRANTLQMPAGFLRNATFETPQQ